ncbi:hypothetical protein Bbelb_292210 [Branchiostoma belcheri]|nr:hypothetical protein Bbelb_292210 [Branchiostoma belcheri]
MAFKIECEERAAKAEDVIHPEMGRGHSNYPQASNNVLIRNPEGLSSVPQVQSLRERLSAVVKSHLRENFMEFFALPATNTTRHWVPAVQYTPVELLDRRQAPYGQKRRKIVSDRYAKLIFWLQPGPPKPLQVGQWVAVAYKEGHSGDWTVKAFQGEKAKIKFFDYRGGGQYAPTQKASELVDPKYIYLVDFPTRKLMGEKIQVDNMEEIIKQYKRGRPRRTWTDLMFTDLQAVGLDVTTAWVASKNREE